MKFLLLLIFAMATPLRAATYYLSPTGSDTNSGTSMLSPWLSPNHPISCGDVVMAQASTAYSAENFGPSKWGAVDCTSANNVAWLKCASFDGCKITSYNSNGMQITSSYWGVQGWEVTISAASSHQFSCFAVVPNDGFPIHHIVLANNIANGCNGDGFTLASTNATSFDYVALVGNIAYNGAQGTVSCASGLSMYQPIASDALPGTHLYIAGNFAWGNINPPSCGGTVSTDGEGVIVDTTDWSQNARLARPYAGQIVVENNLLVSNGGRGIEVYNNSAGGAPHARIYLRGNSVWGNNMSVSNAGYACAELYVGSAFQSETYNNLAVASRPTGCQNNALWGATVLFGDATDRVYSNFIYSPSGNNTASSNSGSFVFEQNTTGIDPTLTHPVAPGAPDCASASSTTACMAASIANFTPATQLAKTFGYQLPNASAVSDPLFPQWLCNVNLPSGLVTMGCKSGTSTSPSQATPSLTWQTPSAITFGTALSGSQLNATASVPGTFTYTPTIGTVPGAGNQTLTVSFTPADTAAYKAVSGTTSLVVNRAVPVLGWPTPASIAAGTALSAAQLNAVANVPGTFSYFPTAGTILDAGKATLTVTFSPVDNNNYSGVSTSRTLTVLQATHTTLSLVRGRKPNGAAILMARVITVPGGANAGGQVTLYTDSNRPLASASLVNGSVSWSVPPNMSNLTVYAAFPGTSTLAPSRSGLLSGSTSNIASSPSR